MKRIGYYSKVHGRPVYVGWKHPKKAREAMSKTRKELFKTGKIKSWNKGTSYHLKPEILKELRRTRKKAFFSKSARLRISNAGKLRLREKNPAWKGGKSLHAEGYILIYKPDHPQSWKTGYILEHRFVMSEKLGRLLKPNEVVHHINHIKDDNRPENLQIKGWAEHTRDHVYKSIEVQCFVCNKLTVKAPWMLKRARPCCSKSCAASLGGYNKSSSKNSL